MIDYKKLCEDLRKSSCGENMDLYDIVQQAADAIGDLQAENEELKKQRNCAVNLAGCLKGLCTPPKELERYLFRPQTKPPEGYTGSGYDFLDGVNRICSDFEQTADEKTYQEVYTIAKSTIWRKGRSDNTEKEDGNAGDDYA